MWVLAHWVNAWLWDRFLWDGLGMDTEARLTETLHIFLYDMITIGLLLVGIMASAGSFVAASAGWGLTALAA